MPGSSNEQVQQRRIVVATGALPLARGGAELLASELASALRRAGHQAEQVALFHRPFGAFSLAYATAACTNVTIAHDGWPTDQAISLRFPAYAIRHPRHVCWMLHRARPYYDLWKDFYQSLGTWRTRAKERLRRSLIHLWDARCLRSVRRLLALSREVQGRLARSGFDSEVLYPPPRHGLDYGASPVGDFILSPSRLDDQKRIDWLLRALARVPGSRAVLVGEGPRKKDLERLALDLGLQDRVEFLGFVPDAELSRLYREARAVYFCPRQEEFGYVALESMHFAKPLLTATDSGGPTELVQDGQSALVASPDPEAIAQALRRLLGEPLLAERLGGQAYERRPRTSWDHALARLLLPPFH